MSGINSVMTVDKDLVVGKDSGVTGNLNIAEGTATVGNVTVNGENSQAIVGKSGEGVKAVLKAGAANFAGSLKVDQNATVDFSKDLQVGKNVEVYAGTKAGEGLYVTEASSINGHLKVGDGDTNAQGYAKFKSDLAVDGAINVAVADSKLDVDNKLTAGNGLTAAAGAVEAGSLEVKKGNTIVGANGDKATLTTTKGQAVFAGDLTVNKGSKASFNSGIHADKDVTVLSTGLTANDLGLSVNGTDDIKGTLTVGDASTKGTARFEHDLNANTAVNVLGPGSEVTVATGSLNTNTLKVDGQGSKLAVADDISVGAATKKGQLAIESGAVTAGGVHVYGDKSAAVIGGGSDHASLAANGGSSFDGDLTIDPNAKATFNQGLNVGGDVEVLAGEKNGDGLTVTGDTTISGTLKVGDEEKNIKGVATFDGPLTVDNIVLRESGSRLEIKGDLVITAPGSTTGEIDPYNDDRIDLAEGTTFIASGSKTAFDKNGLFLAQHLDLDEAPTVAVFSQLYGNDHQGNLAGKLAVGVNAIVGVDVDYSDLMAAPDGLVSRAETAAMAVDKKYGQTWTNRGVFAAKGALAVDGRLYVGPMPNIDEDKPMPLADGDSAQGDYSQYQNGVIYADNMSLTALEVTDTAQPLLTTKAIRLGHKYYDVTDTVTSGAKLYLSDVTITGNSPNFTTLQGDNNIKELVVVHIDTTEDGGLPDADGKNQAGVFLGKSAEHVVTGEHSKASTITATGETGLDITDKMGANWTGENLMMTADVDTDSVRWMFKKTPTKAKAGDEDGGFDLVLDYALKKTTSTDDTPTKPVDPTTPPNEMGNDDNDDGGNNEPDPTPPPSDSVHDMIDDITHDVKDPDPNPTTPPDPPSGDGDDGDGDKGGGLADNPGVQHITDVVEKYPDKAEEAIEGAANIQAIGALPAITNDIASKVSGFVNSRLLEMRPFYMEGERTSGGVWGMPFFDYTRARGFKVDKLRNDYNLGYGGAAVGVDRWFSDTVMAGVAVFAGKGQEKAKGDFDRTTNDFSFYGGSLYNAVVNGNFTLTGDLGLTKVKGDIEQHIAGPAVKADGVGSQALTVGLAGYYDIQTPYNVVATPHLGLRYTHITTDDATVKGRGGDLFKVKTDRQNLVQVPVGVRLSSQRATEGGWDIAPYADLGALFTLGDTESDGRVDVLGTGYSAATKAETVDKAALTTALGLRARKGNISLELDYKALVSEHQNDNGVALSLHYLF